MEDAAFNTAEQGRPLLFRVLMAASQSIAAMGTPLLVPCWNSAHRHAWLAYDLSQAGSGIARGMKLWRPFDAPKPASLSDGIFRQT